MEKMVWEKPEMNDIAFGASEYVAACGDSGKVYKFECNAPGGDLNFYEDFRVTEDQLTTPIDFSGKDLYWSPNDMGDYSSCGEKHEAESTGDFYWGFVDYDKDKKHDTTAYMMNGKSVLETVIVWIEWGTSFLGSKYVKNGHATANLSMRSWETAKS